VSLRAIESSANIAAALMLVCPYCVVRSGDGCVSAWPTRPRTAERPTPQPQWCAHLVRSRRMHRNLIKINQLRHHAHRTSPTTGPTHETARLRRYTAERAPSSVTARLICVGVGDVPPHAVNITAARPHRVHQ
jgi:hypothetical protein